MKKNGFALIFYGMLFVLINIPVNNMDIFPDFIGYIFFAIGYEKLKNTNKYFFRVRKYVWLLIMISAATFYRSAFLNEYMLDIDNLITELALSVLVMIFILLNFHDLFSGIKDLAEKNSHQDISAEATKRWKQVVILNILAFLLIVAVLVPVVNLAYIIGFIIFSIYLTVKIMKLLWRCARVFENKI